VRVDRREAGKAGRSTLLKALTLRLPEKEQGPCQFCAERRKPGLSLVNAIGLHAVGVRLSDIPNAHRCRR
jgi:hypothetical protein